MDAIIRGGLRRYTDQVGHLWNSLADYYIRGGLFERARDVYEESIRTVTTVRDFTQVFDSYAQFEELALSKKMEDLQVRQPPTEYRVRILTFHVFFSRTTTFRARTMNWKSSFIWLASNISWRDVPCC